MEKYVYLFSQGKAEGNAGMREILGGKGANLHEMANLGIPVPPGFTISTRACIEYFNMNKKFPDSLWDEIKKGIEHIEKSVNKKFGDAFNPLLVSVRSGAKFSMPGMMDTILNLGLNETTINGIIKQTEDKRFAYDAYRRFIQMFGKIVLNVKNELFEQILTEFKEKTEGKQDTDLTEEHLKEIIYLFKELIKKRTKREVPENPFVQLKYAIKAVFDSWMGKRAVDYRNFHKISHDLGTAVNVQAMVFGNMGIDSGTGVAFTRNPATGENRLYGEYLLNAQGEDVVAGIRTPQKIEVLERELPHIYKELYKIAKDLERHYRDIQDMEFTIEKGKLYILQTRTGKRTAQAAVKIAVDMVKEGIITKESAIMRIEPEHINQLLHPRFSEEAKEKAVKEGNFLTRGLNASPGAGVGKAIFDANRAEELGRKGEPVILVRPETNPDDVNGMLYSKGILTARGGATSHAAVVARGLGKPCVAGCESLNIDLENKNFKVNGKEIKEGDFISIDGGTGEVFSGKLFTIEPDLEKQTELKQILSWADQLRKLEIWANADYPRDAKKARDFGAQGIGLCRTEHMFFEEERLPIVRKMILAAPKYKKIKSEKEKIEKRIKELKGENVKELKKQLRKINKEFKKHEQDYKGSLQKLQEIQKEDFREILRIMQGLPVVIRLIDPPLHEFLPRYEELLKNVTTGRTKKERKELLKLLEIVEEMREANPMLGLRGVRLGILYPEINEMQVRAIFESASELKKEGVDVHPEIMIPLVSTVNELKIMRELLEKVAKEVMQEKGIKLNYKFGTMIEVPRAALTADEIAEYAEFFSFGTNDLTQTTFGISRDDAEGKFLLHYVENKLLPENPFQVLDRNGVGKLVKYAVEKGRERRKEIVIGICGEHGGDPNSIEFCHKVNLNYVSCSPFRVPVARLCAAQGVIKEKKLAEGIETR